MANSIKYSESSESLALNKGNWWIGTGDSNKGPTVESGYWNAINPPSGGYTVYLNKESNGPSIHSITSDENLISFTNKISGNNYTTVAECLVYYQTQNDKLCVNREYENIVTDGLVLNLDAGYVPSYPISGTTWYDLSGNGNNGSLINEPTYSGDSLVFDGTDDYVNCGMSSFVWGQGLSVFVWLKNIGGDYRGVISTGYYTNGNWEMRFGRENYFGGVNNGTRLGCLVNTVNGFEQLNLNGELNKVGYYGMTYDGEFFKVYSNGILSETTPLSGNIRTFANPVIIGKAFSSPTDFIQCWNSNIYQTSIYDRSLTSDEILQNYNAQKGRFGL